MAKDSGVIGTTRRGAMGEIKAALTEGMEGAAWCECFQ